ncbi:hypothetical protein H5410_002111 [Solanum commersonii]|uniref:Gag-pol polyprotein n=1 Tax=Solanum commersonii TaxID=4109 RepID=A0A9J6B1E6_SOLCO|nr:hypothetical protein H5410_002111 [Solanum commersonii]
MSLFVSRLSHLSSNKECCVGTDGCYKCGMTGHFTKENSPDVVTGILKIFNFDVYALLDPGVSLTFVTPYVAMKFGISLEQLVEPFSVSTLVGNSILAEKVYRNCTIFVNHRDTVADLVELDMVDFNVILGMD